MTSPFNTLPKEIHKAILDHLPKEARCAARLVCKKWNSRYLTWYMFPRIDHRFNQIMTNTTDYFFKTYQVSEGVKKNIMAVGIGCLNGKKRVIFKKMHHTKPVASLLLTTTKLQQELLALFKFHAY